MVVYVHEDIGIHECVGASDAGSALRLLVIGICPTSSQQQRFGTWQPFVRNEPMNSYRVGAMCHFALGIIRV